MQRHANVLLALAVFAGLQVGSVARALAQAWVPPRGEAWVTLNYAYLYNRDHYIFDGSKIGGGPVYSNTVLADLGYSITNRLGVGVSLPFATTRYGGGSPHLFPVDDQSTHGTFTDFHVEARYNVSSGAIALTPFVATILPSHRYDYFGHAVPGIHLKQFLVGTGFGYRFGPGPADPSSKDAVSLLRKLLPNAYVVGRYSYAFVEKVSGISHDRSNLELQLAYTITPALQVFALGWGQYTYGGTLLNPPLNRIEWTAEIFHHHAQTTKSDLISIGGGIDYQIAPSIVVSAGYLQSVAGRNDHTIDSLVTVGVTFGFAPRQVARKMSAQRSAPLPLASGF